ncbi:hypothetical protein TARUN_566 [Trichoderma arundinaceum]|uniref:Uncharacterized protein n=1 Tax=Trichoderma arundinaceum TaxID=490622 RepID=A0A395NZT9_TRIAR|nr:hypothetical protein TARUN_566 [Trichoderma arundinaceum]
MPPLDRYAAERRRLRTMSRPFLNDEFMEGPPRFRGADLKDPRLRRCTFDPKTIVFESRLGGGADGYVWKVRFGDEGPFALKVFWDQTPPREAGTYYSMQRECQNAAVLQMMEAAVACEPVLVYDRPSGRRDAIENYFAFCEENCLAEADWDDAEEMPPPGTRLISSIPRMTKCYGWLKLHSDLWMELPISLQASHKEVSKVRRLIQSHMNCIAIVYELIEEGENVPATVEEVDDFLWHAGFAYTMEPHARNWKGGVLVDHAEIVHTRGYGWNEDDYMKRTAEQILTE